MKKNKKQVKSRPQNRSVQAQANKKNKKRNLNPKVVARRRRVAAARAKLMLFLVVIGFSVWGISKLHSSIEIPPLVVDSADYVQISANLDSESESYFDDDGNLIERDSEFEEDAVTAFQPVLQDTYPIDMIIRSEYALVYDVTANKMLFAKNADEKCYPASTTKILTSAVILDSVGKDFEFTVGDELDFVNEGSSLALLNRGNILSVENIIDGLMLPSGNDAAYTAAANVGRALAKDETLPSREAVDTFIEAMNRKAASLGASSSHFANPDGFHDDNHYTTVLDMLKITLYAKEKPALMASAQKPYVNSVFLSGEKVAWENSNKLIQKNTDIYYMYATGMKTGMTDKSGYCVVATAERFEHEIVCIVFGATASDIRWNDTVALLDASFAHIKDNLE